MQDRRKVRGRRGEEMAAAFLAGQGFRVMAKNWSCRLGEIDLIVERKDEIRFIEVKLRFTTTYGYPEEAITRTKLNHLRRAIEWWLASRPVMPERYQADAIAIYVPLSGEPDIRWIENIL